MPKFDCLYSLPSSSLSPSSSLPSSFLLLSLLLFLPPSPSLPQFVQPTGKRFLLAIDVSGSMESYTVLGSASVTARTASAAMAMVTARTEANYHMMGFSNKLVKLDIDAKMKLEDVCNTISRVSI